MSKDKRIQLKTMKQNEYVSFVSIGILLFLTFFFMFLLRRDQGQSAITFAFVVALGSSIGMLIVLIAFSAHQDRKLHDKQTWEIDESSITYEKTGFLKKTTRVSFNEISEIKLDCISIRLLRGIKVVGKDGSAIFVPQNTDRFYDAQLKLKSLAKST